jgi:hypothetical protein
MSKYSLSLPDRKRLKELANKIDWTFDDING